jgi:hypothetical protein
MGMSPSADLIYGYDLDGLLYDDDYNDLRPQWWQDGDEWEEALARKLGWIEVPFPSEGTLQNLRRATTNWEERKRLDAVFYETPEYQAWSASRDEMRKLSGRFGVSIDYYGYNEDWSHVIKIDNQGFRAYDYGACKVDVKDLVVGPDWDKRLAEFVELLEFQIPEGVKPGWHMTCSYG